MTAICRRLTAIRHEIWQITVNLDRRFPPAMLCVPYIPKAPMIRPDEPCG